MSVLVTMPKYSFLTLNNFDSVEVQQCVEEVNICLPVYELADLKFQIIVYVDGTDVPKFENGEANEITIKAGVCRECGLDNPVPLPPFHFDVTWTHSESYSGAGTDVWIGCFTANATAWDIGVGECFNICFYQVYNPLFPINGVIASYLTCTAYCLQRIGDVCDTSLFKYKCYENSFGFRYTGILGSFENSIRLPAVLKNMALPSEQKSYTTSLGRKIKLFERIEEEYELVVDFVPKDWHKRIKILLAHDLIQIKNSNETENKFWYINCSEAYEIVWLDRAYIHATAKTKVRRDEVLSMINSNCK